MLHIRDEYIRNNMLNGAFGLEKENLRVLSDGSLSHTPHPVPGDDHIVRDFSEGQIEINTDPHTSAGEAVEELWRDEKRLLDVLSELPEPEYLWPFSNPPYIKGEEDIPIAVFKGEDAWKTEYRKHLSCVYGRYKMTFSGIHVNYSLSEKLLRREAELRGIRADDEAGYRDFKNRFYVSLTEKVSYCGWLLVLLTAASPVIDGSFNGGNFGDTVNTGMASLRCSERGYWNFFDPVFDYSGLDEYTDSIEKYVRSGDLMASSELYYPVRLKPNSTYSVETLRRDGAGHIELRMFDLNPLNDKGLDVRDVEFAEYLIVFLAAGGSIGLTDEDQIDVVSNFKYSAKLDLDDVYIIGKGGFREDIKDAAAGLLDCMSEMYESMLPGSRHIHDIISYEKSKIEDDRNRYAYKVLQEYGTDYVMKGMGLAKENERYGKSDWQKEI